MNSKRADISQIQKYLNGELDAKAMHQLEREAQHDPFLMDALEGYGLVKDSQQDNLNGLQARLNERTATKTRRLMPWVTIAAAAAVIGFAVVVGVWYNNKPALKEQVALNEPVKQKQVDTVALLNDGPKIAAPAQEVAAATHPKSLNPVKKFALEDRSKANALILSLREKELAQAKVAKPMADTAAGLDEMVMGYMAANKKTDSIVLGGDKVATTNNASSLTILKSKAEGAMMKPSQNSPNNAYALAKANLPQRLVTGVVLDRTDGSPLPGVSVKVVGQPTNTQTDVNGKFTLPNVKKDENLTFGYIGYSTKTLALQGKDSLKVELEGNSNSLSEVVVTQPAGKQPKAHPLNGWDNLKKYLNDSAIAPNDKEGAVTLRFTVAPNGNLTNIKVTKSLNTEANQKAIELLQQGPAWLGNTNGKPEVVTLKVKFHQLK
ncbi:TonB family protein [Mucilaginibacter phyllosphaerae]